MTTDGRPDRRSPIDMTAEEFREAGHRLVDAIAEFYASLPNRRVSPGEPARALRESLRARELPDEGRAAAELLAETAPWLFEHSLHNGHPRFFGYITSSAAPVGALADLLAAAVNANVGLWDLSPAASEIEAQTVRWLAELVGFGGDCGGLMVSGGNMANFLAFVAARRAKTPWNVREAGLGGGQRRLLAYGSRETHTWIQKAADVTGLGTDAIRWIPTDAAQRLDVAALREQVERDRAAGFLPFIVVGTAGNVSTGAVDPLPAIRSVASEQGLWFHVDGAYGAPAAALPDAPEDLRGIALADSVALDPHKWLYAPIEAACVLVRDRKHLLDAFSYRPPYYHLAHGTGGDDEPGNDYYELGLQNTRGFRALKVWLGLRQIGREGLRRSIAKDIELAESLFRHAERHDELEACTRSLSIATFRYVPAALRRRLGELPVEVYLNDLNEALLPRLKASGELYVSNAVLGGRYVLRACIVNFRTSAADVASVPDIVARHGRVLDRDMRPPELAG
ncbi:MAG: aspartate aminotransferase family protein [Gammaproteobacteria bacterium]|nr:aspartate aminotransferase family protein [Gammaproteobacteria bacterium]